MIEHELVYHNQLGVGKVQNVNGDKITVDFLFFSPSLIVSESALVSMGNELTFHNFKVITQLAAGLAVNDDMQKLLHGVGEEDKKWIDELKEKLREEIQWSS